MPELPPALSHLAERVSHLRGDGDYATLFEEARQATSLDDRPINQSTKFLRQAGLFLAARDALAGDGEGDVAECGCFRGQAAFWLARMIERGGRPRALHLFDSFEGLSEFAGPDLAAGGPAPERVARMRAHFRFPEESVRAALAPFPFVEIRAGWIPDRFAEVADRRFVLVHIDVDLYQPTLDSLRFFWPRLVPGGRVVVDDYNALSYPGAAQAVHDFAAEAAPAAVVPLQVGGCVIVR